MARAPGQGTGRVSQVAFPLCWIFATLFRTGSKVLSSLFDRGGRPSQVWFFQPEEPIANPRVQQARRLSMCGPLAGKKGRNARSADGVLDAGWASHDTHAPMNVQTGVAVQHTTLPQMCLCVCVRVSMENKQRMNGKERDNCQGSTTQTIAITCNVLTA